MFATRSLVCGALASLAICVAGAPVTAKPASKAKRPPASISVENGRSIALSEFEITHIEPAAKPGAKAKPSRKPVGQLSEPLAPGETKALKLSGAAGCTYLARWKFEDAGDEGKIDICGDPKIVLTD